MRETRERQVELLERHFRQEEMLHALVQLCDMVGEQLPVKRQQSQGRTATRAQAEDVVDLVDKSDTQGNIPRFIIQTRFRERNN